MLRLYVNDILMVGRKRDLLYDVNREVTKHHGMPNMDKARHIFYIKVSRNIEEVNLALLQCEHVRTELREVRYIRP